MDASRNHQKILTQMIGHGYEADSVTRQETQTWMQILLCTHLKELGIETIAEYQFYPERKWRADLACLDRRLLFEADGGKWHGGHRRGKALEDDYERQNTAILLGWRLLRFTNEQIMSGWAREFVKRWIG